MVSQVPTVTCSHIKRETQLMESNIKHSNERNLLLMEDVYKSYQRAFKNVPMVMKVVRETNREKRGVGRFIGELERGRESSSGEGLGKGEGEGDLSRYKDILEEYRSKM